MYNLHKYLAGEINIPGILIKRTKLISKLNNYDTIPLIIINSGAGSGKTSLLYLYNRQLSVKCTWLQGSEKIIDGVSLALHMAYSLNRMFPGSFENTLKVLNNSDSMNASISVNDAAMVFCNDLFEAINKLGYIKFILDDFQLIASGNHAASGIDEFLNTVFASPVKGFTLILSTRHTTTFNKARLKTKQLMFELYENDIRFYTYEIFELGSRVYNIVLNDNECENIYNKTSGWITGIHLLMQNYNNAGTSPKTTELFYNYFIEEIFNTVPVNHRDFLIKTSFLEEFTSELCQKAFSISDSEEIIEALISKNVFLEENLSDEINLEEKDNNQANTSYKYQKVFRDFLTTYVKKTGKQEEYLKFNLNVVRYYTERNSFKKALSCILIEKNPDLVISFYKEYIIYNKAAQTDISYLQFLQFLSEEMIYKNSDVLCYYLMLSDLSLNFGTNHLELIDKLPVKRKELGLLLKSNYFLNNGDIKNAEAMLNSLTLSKLQPEMHVKYYRIYSRVMYRKGFKFTQETQNMCETGLELAVKLDDKSSIVDFSGLLGNLYDNRSEYLNASYYFNKAVDFNNNILDSFKYSANLINNLVALGEIYKAEEKLKEIISYYKKYPLSSAKRFINRSKEKLAAKLTDFETCINIVSETLVDKTVKINGELIWAGHLSMANYYFYINDITSALQELILADKFAVNEYNKMINSYMKSRINIFTGCLNEEIEQTLLECVNFHKSNQIIYILSRLYLDLAKFYFVTGKYESSAQYINITFEMFDRFQLTDLIICELIVATDFLDFARRNKSGNKLIKEAVFAINEYLNSGLISLKAKERLLLVSKKCIDIKFLPFGSTEFHLRGETIPEDKWIRKKSKILLAYLMSDPERIHTKDEIIDMFFDNMPDEKADVAYHSAVYNIRTALKIYDIKSGKPKRSKDKTYDYNPQYILYEDKTLRLNPDFYYKSANIEFEKHFSKTILPSITNEEKITHSVKAIELYKGDFIPGYYDNWCEELRVKYKNMYITMCEELIKLFENNKRYEDAIKYSELLFSEDKLNDSAHISIINAFSKLGNINMAKSRYQLMLKIYDEELGEKPQSKTLEKINTILN